MLLRLPTSKKTSIAFFCVCKESCFVTIDIQYIINEVHRPLVCSISYLLLHITISFPSRLPKCSQLLLHLLPSHLSHLRPHPGDPPGSDMQVKGHRVRHIGLPLTAFTSLPLPTASDLPNLYSILTPNPSLSYFYVPLLDSNFVSLLPFLFFPFPSIQTRVFLDYPLNHSFPALSSRRFPSSTNLPFTIIVLLPSFSISFSFLKISSLFILFYTFSFPLFILTLSLYLS